MFDVDRNNAPPASGNVSRRSALRTGGFAALFAALLPHAAAANVEVPAKATTKPYVIIDLDHLAAASREALAKHQAANEEWSAVKNELQATLTPEQKRLLVKVTDAQTDADLLQIDLVVAELARHFPGLAPAIGLIWEEHLLPQHFDAVGRCCVAAQMEGEHVG